MFVQINPCLVKIKRFEQKEGEIPVDGQQIGQGAGITPGTSLFLRMIRSAIRIFTFVILLAGCKTKNEPAPAQNKPTLYFPTAGSSTWDTVAPADLGWNVSNLPDLQSWLSSSGTRAFIVLKDGKIAMEYYMGQQLTSASNFTATSNWYWASAGKTLTSALAGIANGQGKINFSAKSSQYLGMGWTNCTADQENKITVMNQLTMTTGLDDSGDTDCTDPACLTYKADAGTRWAYHNAPYTLLDNVITAGTGFSPNDYISKMILTPTGMDGMYVKTGENNVFYSTARSMARYGLLLLNKGIWDGTTVIPSSYFNLMTTSSQNFNLSYGYLTWLNGKNSFMVPQSQVVFNGELTTGAPADMFAAMGKNGQIINVVPSLNLVVVRMGDDESDTGLVAFDFQNELWTKLSTIVK